MQDRTVELAEGVALDLLFAGPSGGEPVVLLHGFPESAMEWRDVIPPMVEQGLRVLAPNLRGYSAGARPPGVEFYDQAHLVRDVLDLLDACGLGGAHLVGHDWGAMVAWSVAARHPDRVRTLTAVSVPHPAAFAEALAGDADQQQRSRYIGLLLAPGKAEDTLLADGARRLRAMLVGVPPEIAADHVARLTEPGALTGALSYYRAPFEPYATLPPVGVPTTFVWGADDIAIGRRAAEGGAAYVTGRYRFVELAAGHWLPETSPAQVAAAVLDRVRSVSGRPPRAARRQPRS